MGIPATILAEASQADARWRDLAFDVSWEASESGVIRCCGVYNRRTDIFQAVEGLHLRDITCETQARSLLALLTAQPDLRHIAVRIPRAISGRLYTSARRQHDGSIVGTFCALDARLDDTLAGQSELLARISHARQREETYRQEADVLLAGLRLLLGEATIAQKLETLGRLLTSAIGGAACQPIHVSVGGAIRALNGMAIPAAAQAAILSMRCGDDGIVSVVNDKNSHLRALHTLLGVRSGEVALVTLPLGPEAIVFVCNVANTIALGDLDFISRFTLVLRQATLLKEEQDKLVQAAKLSALGQMTASLAHELRQPLNAIGMAAQNLMLLAECGNANPVTVREKAERIKTQVKRTSDIIDRVRRFSRKGGAPFANTDLAVAAESVRVLSTPSLQNANIRLDIDMAPDLCVFCDPVQVEQTIANLVRNAIDALAGVGSTKPTAHGVIAIKGWRTAQGIVLRVQDNGPGFPPAILEHPQETFFTTKSADHGTGLGLTICHTIAREHAGRLVLGNDPSGGAFVELHLPERHR